MKFIIWNLISGISFFFSSICVLSIPFLSLKEGFPVGAYLLAGLFWGGFLCGLVLQILLAFACRKLPIVKSRKPIRMVLGIAFFSFLLASVPVAFLFRDKTLILPINLFALLLSAEAYFVVRRMENLEWENWCLAYKNNLSRWIRTRLNTKGNKDGEIN